MSQHDPGTPPHVPGPPDGPAPPRGRNRARVLLPAGFVVLVVLVFLFIFLVSRTRA